MTQTQHTPQSKAEYWDYVLECLERAEAKDSSGSLNLSRSDTGGGRTHHSVIQDQETADRRLDSNLRRQEPHRHLCPRRQHCRRNKPRPIRS